MKRIYPLLVLFLLFSGLNSCSKDEDEQYVNTSENDASLDKNGPNATGPIHLDLTQVPLPTLSDYHFFVGSLKDLKPGYMVVPYKPSSELFSDYAHKKRFIWMPKGTSATYVSDDNVFNFPVGTVMIKTFYYDHVQPANETRILETRLLIKTAEGAVDDSGWKLYDYIWNEAQTEAFLDTNGNGVFIPVTFTENAVTRSINYKVPASVECATCHKFTPAGGFAQKIPIGLKPQNLNSNFNYSGIVRNQLTRLKQLGYINNSLPDVASINATVDWTDTSKPLDIRARSYIDANCAHCHRLGGHCDYTPMRFNFSNNDTFQLGVCMIATSGGNPYIIKAGNADESDMVVTMTTSNESIRMPLIGRSVVHDEGVQLIKDWINSMPNLCD